MRNVEPFFSLKLLEAIVVLLIGLISISLCLKEKGGPRSGGKTGELQVGGTVITHATFISSVSLVWASLVAQRLKRLPGMQETRVRSLGWEDSLEKEMATHSSIHAWRLPWTEEPGRLQSTGSQRVGHDWASSLSLYLHSAAQSVVYSEELWDFHLLFAAFLAFTYSESHLFPSLLVWVSIY